jgi:hypothetical protein
MVTRASALPAINAYPAAASPLSTGRRQLLEMRRAREASATRGPADVDESAVREQLLRVLGSVFFRNSDRYTRLLQYVVDTALHSDPALLKERLIGVNVFGRDPSYDTVKDNVVRIAAAEVRGRLVRYYALPEHRPELRIVLYPGSYVPQFVPADLAQQPQPPAPTEEVSTLNSFWGPLLQCLEPILIVLGPSQGHDRRNAAARTKADGGPAHRNLSEQITLSDALTLSRLVSYLESRGKEYRVEMQGFVRFRDLRNGPAILLGGLNNQWTLSFAEHLRFAFKTKQGSSKTWIRDRDLPSRQLWIHDSNVPLPAITEDHAIVARLLESATGQPMVIAGGHTAYGTAAAGELVTNGAYLESFMAGETQDWGSSNLQLVIATSVVRGVSGPPRISATYIW